MFYRRLLAFCLRERVREVSLGILGDDCRVAAEIGASCVVVHPGFMPWRHATPVSYTSCISIRIARGIASARPDGGFTAGCPAA